MQIAALKHLLRLSLKQSATLESKISSASSARAFVGVFRDRTRVPLIVLGVLLAKPLIAIDAVHRCERIARLVARRDSLTNGLRKCVRNFSGGLRFHGDLHRSPTFAGLYTRAASLKAKSRKRGQPHPEREIAQKNAVTQPGHRIKEKQDSYECRNSSAQKPSCEERPQVLPGP